MNIVYFDGVCNLCNTFVDFLITRDSKRRMKFTALQGQTATDRLPQALRESLSSVVFEDSKGTMYVHSAAALRAIAALGGVYRIALGFLLMPAPLRDLVYKTIARRRYVWFGKRDTCRLPTPDERRQFLN